MPVVHIFLCAVVSVRQSVYVVSRLRLKLFLLDAFPLTAAAAAAAAATLLDGKGASCGASSVSVWMDSKTL